MSSSEKRYPLDLGLAISERLTGLLAPHCQQGFCQVAGSIRRNRPTFGDIEIVCLPLPYQAEPLFRSGIASVLGEWDHIRGTLGLGCRMFCCWIPEGFTDAAGMPSPRVKLDLYMPRHESWGLIMAIRTGSADWAHHVLASAWCKAGYESRDGVLVDYRGVPARLASNSEEDLFKKIGLPWVDPWDRELGVLHPLKLKRQ